MVGNLFPLIMKMIMAKVHVLAWVCKYFTLSLWKTCEDLNLNHVGLLISIWNINLLWSYYLVIIWQTVRDYMISTFDLYLIKFINLKEVNG